MIPRLQSTLEELWGLERRADKLGLEGTRELLAALGDPQQRFRSVHVAGTNGKGSVCALVERVLRDAGPTTGLYTSPHLVDFRERIRVNGRWPDEAVLLERLEAIRALPAGRDRTFFEVATALAFDHFAREGVDWAVVEAGLGGRLDSTNVLAPTVTAISSIGLDHAEVLGTTHEAIAIEKAGILKPGVPVVSGVEHDSASPTIEKIAHREGAPFVHARDVVDVREVQSGPWGTRLSVTVSPWGTFWLSLGLRGRHQIENARVALAILRALVEQGVSVPLDALRSGFADVRWPGRLEPCVNARRLWWDGAHNLDGIRRLVQTWRDDMGMEPPVAIVFAVARDKDAHGMLARLHAFAPDARLLVTRTRSERAADPERTRRDGARRRRARSRCIPMCATPCSPRSRAARTGACCSPGRCSRWARRWRRSAERRASASEETRRAGSPARDDARRSGRVGRARRAAVPHHGGQPDRRPGPRGRPAVPERQPARDTRPYAAHG